MPAPKFKTIKFADADKNPIVVCSRADANEIYIGHDVKLTGKAGSPKFIANVMIRNSGVALTKAQAMELGQALVAWASK